MIYINVESNNGVAKDWSVRGKNSSDIDEDINENYIGKRAREIKNDFNINGRDKGDDTSLSQFQTDDSTDTPWIEVGKNGRKKKKF